MKCSRCGKEFGNGSNCKNCGTDRVTGLANYSGYDKPLGSYEPHYSSSVNGGYAPNTTVCYACNEIIPANSEFCPYCSKQLYVTCPVCGNAYSSQFPACNKCGTNRDSYYKQREVERQRKLREEKERERKQREWEQSPEGKAELARKRAYIDECKKKFTNSNSSRETSPLPASILFKIFGAIALIGGIAFLILTISEPAHRKDIEGYIGAILMIIWGYSLLFSKK